MHILFLSGFLAALSPYVHAVQYVMTQNYSGANFFDGWNFYNGQDVNNTGRVIYQDKAAAMQQQLAYINSAGNAVIKVDNTTIGDQSNPEFNRSSVKILSQVTYSSGSLVLMDAVHMPFGVLWPAFWSVGPVWPDDGEIDIVENVNMRTNNQYSLHTLDGCRHPEVDGQDTFETGTLTNADCFNQTSYNTGCLVRDPSENSYGSGFASIGGGVFALLWDASGIKIWFFQRSAIPADLPTANPNPSSWPMPVAAYPAASCDFNKFFSPQTLIFQTTICGGFAGSNYGPPCTGECEDLVYNPANYNDAYFEIPYVRIFTDSSLCVIRFPGE
ncbi:hypothetical protein BD410DRAFT_722698 [Rickenella mellea]|uniref:GH16 domain-containing protein n=1 Tax=Rickenella mellea TaxID=50990 RepID=A0A4Y7Q4F5_9AGAM|nr:hypothetical protein BD410DRAFT_722698 [Rickenella mellea]